MPREWVTAAAVALLTFAVVCCSSHPQTASKGPGKTPATSASAAPQTQAASSTQPAAPQAQAASNTQPAATGSASQPEAAPQPAVTPPEPVVESYALAAGTSVHIRLDDALSSESATPGTEFHGTLSVPLVSRGIVVVPAGSKATGQVVAAERGGRLSHPAELSLVLTSLTMKAGKTFAVSTRRWSVVAQSRKKRNLETIGGGAGLGALIGAVAGKGKGAAIGAAVGAGAGTAGAAFTGKKQVVLEVEKPLRFVLSRPVTVTRTPR